MCPDSPDFAVWVYRSANTLVLVSRAVGSFIKLYLLLLFVRVLLSWFPKFEWDTQPWLALRQVRQDPPFHPAPTACLPQ